MNSDNHLNHHNLPSSPEGLSFIQKMNDAFSQYGFMPHGHCYLWKPLLVSIHVVSDALIGTAYLAISITLYGLVKKIRLPFNGVVLCFGVFIGACGLTHFMEIWNLWNADYWWSAWFKVITAAASVGTGIYLYKLRHIIVGFAETVKMNEKSFIQLADFLPQIIWTAKPDGNLDYYNQRWYDFTGFPRDEEGDHSWVPILHPDDVNMCLDRWYHSVRTGEEYKIEYRFKNRKTDQYQWFLGRATPIRNEAGEIIKWYGSCTDIHEQKMSEGQLVDVLESMGDGFIALDKEFKVLRVNHHQERISGLKREQTIGRNHWDIWPKEVIPKIWVAYHQVIQNHKPIHIEDFNSELKIWLSVDAYHTPDNGIAAFFRDITEQKKITQALEDSELQFRNFADSMPQLAWIAKADGFILWYNQRWYDFTGTTAQEMEGWGWQSVHDPNKLPEVLERWQASITTGNPFEMQFPLKGADGKFKWFLTRVIPIRDKDGDIFRWFGTNTNIDDQRLLEIELKKTVQARDEFLSIASHELKTPLTALLIQAQLHKRLILKADPEALNPSRINQNADQTEKLVIRLNRIVEDMLDISRLKAGHLQYSKTTLDICKVLKAALERMNPQIIQAGYEAPSFFGEKAEGNWDVMRIEQVVNNLLTNAVRYGAGKPITVKLQNLGKVARITVQDHGIGIAAEDQERIFKRYERAISSNEVSGLGLGLFICYQIVEAHEGRIWVESEIGKGSTFIVELPLINN